MINRLLNARAVIIFYNDSIVNIEIKGNKRIVLRILAEPLPPVPSAATKSARRIADTRILSGNSLAIRKVGQLAKFFAGHVLFGRTVARLACNDLELRIDVYL